MRSEVRLVGMKMVMTGGKDRLRANVVSIQYETQGYPSFFTVCPPSRSEDPPWILKRVGLESSGQRQIFLNGKNKQ